MFMTLTPDWYDWVPFDEAKFIVVGSDHMSGYGVVATTREVFPAHRIKKFVNDNGGCVEVQEYNDEAMNAVSDKVIAKLAKEIK